MVDVSWGIQLAVMMFVLCITPGASNLFLLSAGLFLGFRGALPVFLGNAVGYWTLFCVVALGGAQFMQQHRAVTSIMMLGGLGYLLWLVIQLFRLPPPNTNHNGPVLFNFTRAFTLVWLNVKAWMVSISIISSFQVKAMALLPWLVIMLMICMPIQLVCTLLYCGLEGIFKDSIRRDPTWRTLRTGLALSLLGVWCWMAWDMLVHYLSQ